MGLAAALPIGAREPLLGGSWDATAVLLEAGDTIERTGAALPYLADYPYGCTEQTLNRFLPTVITQKILLEMGLDLEAIRKKQTNLNAQ